MKIDIQNRNLVFACESKNEADWLISLIGMTIDGYDIHFDVTNGQQTYDDSLKMFETCHDDLPKCTGEFKFFITEDHCS